jgi:hypothetical protein
MLKPSKVNSTVESNEEVKNKDTSSNIEEPIDIEKGESNQTKAVNFVSVFLGTTYVFTMIALYFGGLFIEKFQKQFLFQITAIFCIIPFIVVFIMYERRRTTATRNTEVDQSKRG